MVKNNLLIFKDFSAVPIHMNNNYVTLYTCSINCCFFEGKQIV